MKRFILLFLLILYIPFSYSADFKPSGDIVGRGIYDIYDFVEINGTNGSYDVLCISGSCQSTWPSGSGSKWSITGSEWLINNSGSLDWNETKGNNTYLLKSDESSLDVNSAVYWNGASGLDRFLYVNSGILNWDITELVNSIGNWSADKDNYYTKSIIDTRFLNLNNYSMADIASNIGNWSADKSSYYTTSEVDQRINQNISLLDSQKADIGDCGSGYAVQNLTSTGPECSYFISDGNTGWENQYGYWNNKANWSSAVSYVDVVNEWGCTGLLSSDGTCDSNTYVTSVSGSGAISSSGGQNPTISINSDSIDDTYLTYNTGQHLTTSSNVQFQNITISQAYSIGTSNNQKICFASNGTIIIDAGAGITCS